MNRDLKFMDKDIFLLNLKVMKNLSGSLLLVSASLFAGVVVEHNAPGNLQSTISLNCVAFDKLTNKMTPADLYPAVKKCFDEKKYERGVELFILAGCYGEFDRLRVSDKTAWQAKEVMLIQLHDLFTKKQLESFVKALKPYEDKKGQQLISLCQDIQKLGPPDYYPTYMIQHGIHAFLPDGDENPLVMSFDANKSWEDTLHKYLHCP
jgi:hypothetical protein